MEDLVEIRQDLLSLGKTEKLLDILIQTSRGVEHSLGYIECTVQSCSRKQAAYIFSGAYQWHLAGVEVCIKQERVDEDFLEN